MCSEIYTHPFKHTPNQFLKKVNAMHFQVGDNDTSPAEHQRHERELIHKNLPSSDGRDGPLRLDKTPRGGDSDEKKQIWDILNRHQHTINGSFQASLSTGVNLHITGAKTRGRRSKKRAQFDRLTNLHLDQELFYLLFHRKVGLKDS